MRLYKNRAIIFDFDGVLADSFDPLYALNFDAMRHVGHSFTRQNYRDLFIDNVHKNLRGMIPDHKKFKQFSKYKEERFPHYYKQVELFNFSKFLVRQLSRRSYLGIVSSTKKNFIEELLSREKLISFFAVVAGSDAVSKKEELIQTCEEMGSDASKTYFVTDTVGDLQLGKKLSFRTIAVTWGFHAPSLLKKAHPEAILEDPEELLNYFSGRN